MRATPLNPRKAMAGLKILQGMRIGDALREAGFSKWTARAPAAKGLDAMGCLEEATKLDPECKPANLLASARRVFGKKLRQLEDDEEILKLARPGEIARTAEVAERYYGAGEPLDSLDETRSPQERIEFLRALLNRFEAGPVIKLEPAPDPTEIERHAAHDSLRVALLVEVRAKVPRSRKGKPARPATPKAPLMDAPITAQTAQPDPEEPRPESGQGGREDERGDQPGS